MSRNILQEDRPWAIVQLHEVPSSAHNSLGNVFGGYKKDSFGECKPDGKVTKLKWNTFNVKRVKGRSG
jgi:hypothetical protein